MGWANVHTNPYPPAPEHKEWPDLPSAAGYPGSSHQHNFWRRRSSSVLAMGVSHGASTGQAGRHSMPIDAVCPLAQTLEKCRNGAGFMIQPLYFYPYAAIIGVWRSTPRLSHKPAAAERR